MTTAKEFWDYACKNEELKSPSDIMIEFTKLHVQAALKAAHRNMQLPEEDLEFTLDSYPLENIK